MDLTKFIVLGIYVAILFLIGILASRRVNSLSDFYLGGKRLGYWAVAFSARATGESGWLLIGLTGMGALSGFSAYWVVVGEVLGVAVSWWFMAKRFKRKSDTYGSITIPDYLESHFKSTKKTLRILSASILSIFVIIYVSSQIDVTGKAFESMMGLDYFTGAIIGFLIVLSYIFIGGFVAAVWSDMFQGILMFLGLVLLPIVVFFSMNGTPGVIESLNAIDPALTNVFGTSDDMWMNIATMLGFALIGLGFLGSPQVYVRFMSIRDESEIDKGKWVAIIFTLFTDAAAVTIGILGRVFFTESGQDPQAVLGVGAENVLSMLTEQFLPYVLVAIYVAIVLSAIMSTIDSLLVIASSAITRDFYQKIFKPNLGEKEMVKISRWVTLIMSVIALIIAMVIAKISPDRTVFWMVIFGWSGIAATFCPVIILSLFWEGLTEKGAIASMITGFLCVPFFKFVVIPMEGIGPYFEKLDVLGPSFLISMLMAWLFSKLYKVQNSDLTEDSNHL
ncbi:MAG: sodium/proline symporter [Crocinitomicaceae bacterium]|nr:sodium/proline symporter [Crocinitomicaceae bacterium]MDG1735607.1 sodium/proline symporter [Crocinitomicaceae bacterium]MDG2504663.1 sodium/proline symporter [Crocinitomicaceae bacterium]